MFNEIDHIAPSLTASAIENLLYDVDAEAIVSPTFRARAETFVLAAQANTPTDELILDWNAARTRGQASKEYELW